jgi:hypothetical protein
MPTPRQTLTDCRRAFLAEDWASSRLVLLGALVLRLVSFVVRDSRFIRVTCEVVYSCLIHSVLPPCVTHGSQFRRRSPLAHATPTTNATATTSARNRSTSVITGSALATPMASYDLAD